MAERLAEGPLRPHLVRDLAAGLASALTHVHAHGFIHRDIKPANILLEHGREPRLADFGIAKAVDGTVVTAAGAISGTAAYLAPEQARGDLVGSPADVYALGLVLLEALTGRREYPGTAIESATARLYRRPAVPAGLPFNLTALLKSMTDPDPAARPTAKAVAASLDAGTWPQPRPARRRTPALVGAGLLLFFVIGGASLLLNSGATSGAGDVPGSTSSVIAATPTAAIERRATEPSREQLTPPPADDVIVMPSSTRQEAKGSEKAGGIQERGRGHGSNKHDE